MKKPAAATRSRTGSTESKVSKEQQMSALLLEMLNYERSIRGLPRLALDRDLTMTATQWSARMASTKSLTHRNLGTLAASSPALAKMNQFGENLARGTSKLTALEAHETWMRSSSHRENILSPHFDRVGISVACSSDGKMYATQDFGRLAPPAPSGQPLAKAPSGSSAIQATFGSRNLSCEG